MRMIKSLFLLLTGVAFGIGFVLSCGDDSPRRLDAATCDCPASEPPLAGRLVTNAGDVVTIAGGIAQGIDAGCSPGQQVLSGSCAVVGASIRNVTLQQSLSDKAQPRWLCQFRNNETTDVQVQATVLCLKPPM
jgi:hypothetical protein